MATLRDIQRKIAAVKKTRQITKAMNMVAASKLRGAQQKMEDFRPYALKFAEVIGNIAARTEPTDNPLLRPRDAVKAVNLVLVTSDRGLCGGFNTNIIARAEELCTEKKSENIEIVFTAVGRKGRDYARRYKYAIEDVRVGIAGGNFGFNAAVDIGRSLINGYLRSVYDEVYIVYTQFVSMARQVPIVRKLIPVSFSDMVSEHQGESVEKVPYLAEHICEPSAAALLDDLLPRYVYVQLYRALLESTTSEHAARMMAMDNATKNCNEMIDQLTLLSNKARQAAITKELMDIVGGAEALKG